MSRYFVSSSVQFTFSAVLGAQASYVTAQIWVGGTIAAIVGLGAGIVGSQVTPGVWQYSIANKELSVNGSCMIKWFGQDASQVNADTYPELTYPTIAVVNSAGNLSVTATSVTNNATGISTRDSLTLTFSEDLDTDIDMAGVMLRIVGSATTVPVQAYVNPDNLKQLVIKPKSDLAETTLYEVRIETSGVYGTSGIQLAAGYDLRFTTGADDFQSVTEVTSEGVVERAAPIILANAPAQVNSSLVSSAPADGLYNWLGTQFLFTMGVSLDETVVPTVTLDWSPVFGLNELYWVNNGLWGLETEPTLPLVDTITVSGKTVLIELDSTIGNAKLTITISGLQDVDGNVLDDVSITVTTQLRPYRVGVPEVKNLARQYIADDLTDQLIAEMITNIGLFWYARVGDNALATQRRVILYETALQVMDDWWATRGAGAGESKTLGAFSVSYGGGAAAFSIGPYGRLKKKLDDAEHDLIAYFSGPLVAVKSADNPLEHKNYRIRLWRDPTYDRTDLDENLHASRLDKLPDQDPIVDESDNPEG